MQIALRNALGDTLFNAFTIFKLLWHQYFGYIQSKEKVREMETTASKQLHELISLTDYSDSQLNDMQRRWLERMIKWFSNIESYFGQRYKLLCEVENLIKKAETIDQLPFELNEVTEGTYLRILLRERRMELNKRNK